jgi:threonine dehydratase
MPDLVTLGAIRDAAERLAPVLQRTPVEPSRAVSEQAGVRVLLKCEHLQRTGSFKLRGAYNRISRLADQDRTRGVVCASAGNHAQGVAMSARLTGMRAAVVNPGVV